MKSTNIYWVLAVVVAMTLAGCESKPEKKARYMERAESHFSEENYDKARLEYQNVLQIDPKDVSAQFRLAQINERLGNTRKAIAGYRYVVENDDQHLEARIKLGEVYFTAGATDLARETVEEALALNPGSADAVALRGAVRLREGNTVSAKSDAEAALALEPGHAKAAMLLASLHVKEGRQAEAVKLLQSSIGQHPDNKAMRLVLADIFAGQQEIDKASEYLREIIALDPDTLAHRIRLASYYLKTEHAEEAEAVLRQAVADAPDDVKAKTALVDFIAQTKGMGSAEQALKSYIAAEPKVYDLQFALASLYLRNDKTDEAKAVYRDVIEEDKLGKDGQEARSNLARVLVSQNDASGALALVNEVLAENPRHHDSLVLRATLALSEQDPLSAIADVRALLRDQPESVSLLQMLARAHAMNDEIELAKDNYRRALDVQPLNTALSYEYAQLLLSQDNQSEEAREQLQKVVKLEPTHRNALNSLFRTYVLSEAWTEAENVASQLKTALPDDGIGYYFAGLIKDAKGDKRQAIDEFETALAKQPSAVEPLSGIVKAYLSMEDVDAAAERLSRAKQDLPESPVVRNLLGEVNVVRNDYDSAEREFKEAIELSPQFAVPYRNLSRLYVTQEHMSAAIEILEQGLANTDRDTAVVFQLATLYERNGDSDAAIAQYEALLERDPQSIPAANNLAMLLVTYRSEDRTAMNRAAKLIERLKGEDNPAYLDTVGLVNYKHGKLDDAIVAFEQAVEVAPEARLLRYRLGKALYDKGQLDQARRNLELALEGEPRFDGVADAQALLQTINSAAVSQ